MHPVIESLLQSPVVITDGAWGTQLQQRGLAFGACPDAWNVTHEALVLEVAEAYAKSGSRIILTNTFGSSRLNLSKYGLEAKTRELNEAGARISKQAAGGTTLVFASMGPTGKLLLMEETTEDELLETFSEQAAALKAGGADGLVIETMSDLDEARIAVAAAKATGLPVVACMVFDAGEHRDRTMMGATPEQVADALAEAGADVIGANCGNGILGYVPVCERLAKATTLPIWIKANAGLPQVVEGKAVYTTTPEEFSSGLTALRDAGARFVGGCCGTSPAHIAALASTSVV